MKKQLEGEGDNEGLEKQRKKIKAKKENGEEEVIPDIIKTLVLALTPEVDTTSVKEGENIAGEKAVAEIKIAKDHPAEYLQNILADALTDPQGMAKLEKSMIKANLLSEADKKSFENFMNLGLKPEERATMIAKGGGKGLLGLSGILGLLAYLSWKKSQEGGQPQMG